MEVEKLFKISTEYLSDYLRVLLATIRSPKLEFQPIQLQIETPVITQVHDSEAVKLRLNSKLLGFLLISIFIGSVLTANIPGRSPAPEFVITMVIVIAYWILLSSLINVICRLFIGRESFIKTLSVNLQVLAVIHVLSSMGTFLWGIIVMGLGSGKAIIYLQNLVGKTVIQKPIYAYFAIQFVLVLIYLPSANRQGHKFGFSRLHRGISNRGLSAALARVETGLFYIVFLALSVLIVELNMTNYHSNNVLLSQPEQHTIDSLRQKLEWLIEEQRQLERLIEKRRHLELEINQAMVSARIEEAARLRLSLIRPNEIIVPVE